MDDHTNVMKYFKESQRYFLERKGPFKLGSSVAFLAFRGHIMGQSSQCECCVIEKVPPCICA